MIGMKQLGKRVWGQLPIALDGRRTHLGPPVARRSSWLRAPSHQRRWEHQLPQFTYHQLLATTICMLCKCFFFKVWNDLPKWAKKARRFFGGKLWPTFRTNSFDPKKYPRQLVGEDPPKLVVNGSPDLQLTILWSQLGDVNRLGVVDWQQGWMDTWMVPWMVPGCQPELIITNHYKTNHPWLFQWLGTT